MCIHVPPNLFQETRMPNFEETSDLAKQVRKMSIRNAINLLADVLQERQEMERGEPGPQGVSGKDSTVPGPEGKSGRDSTVPGPQGVPGENRSEEHTSELQSHSDLVCRLLLEK